MGFKEIPGGKEMLVHEDGRVRIGLRNLPADSTRLVWPVDKDGNRKNEWPTLTISVDRAGIDKTMLLPEAVLKTHGELPPSLVCHPEDFTPINGSRINISDSAKNNIKHTPGSISGEKESGEKYIESPDKRDANVKPVKKTSESSADSPKDKVPEGNADAVQVNEGLEKLQNGSAELTAKEAISIINEYDFEELRDLNFYTEDDRENGPRTTVAEAWAKKLEEYSGNA